VLALVPVDAPLEGCAADLLGDCDATVIRYGRLEPHMALDARLGELELEQAAAA
jgi:predicted nuclease with RNAse H fold